MANPRVCKNKNVLASSIPPKSPVHAEVAALPLLRHEKAFSTVPGWPTAPKRIRKAPYLVVWNSFYDLILITCACAFLAFAAIVGYYDQTPTADHPLARGRLQDATNYVGNAKLYRTPADYYLGSYCVPHSVRHDTRTSDTRAASLASGAW